jgi:hypothetical protein
VSGKAEGVAIVNTEADKPRLFAFNLLTLLALGVALSFWTLYYTDFFPVVGGLLGLTGVFAWIGFIANILVDDRKKALRNWFDQSVLLSNVPWMFSIVVLLAFGVAVVARTGTLIIDSRADDTARMVSVRPALSGGGTDTGQKLSVAPRSESHELLATGWLQPARYRVSASGLPDVYVDIVPTRRVRIAFPDAGFSAPVVLVRPDAALSGIVAAANFEFEVSRNGEPFGQIAEYRGNTVWVGAGRDVTIPQQSMARWRTETAAVAADRVLSRWSSPDALAGGAPLSFGDKLRAAIIDPADGRLIAAACRTVVIPASRAEYPQELVIHADTQC